MRKRVLILDDQFDNVEVMRLMLEEEGFEVLGIYDDTKLDEKLASFKPHLIVMDIHLSGADGRLLSNALKSNPATSHLPIILISTSLNPNKGMESPNLADDYLAKPFDLMELVAKVNALLAS